VLFHYILFFFFLRQIPGGCGRASLLRQQTAVSRMDMTLVMLTPILFARCFSLSAHQPKKLLQNFRRLYGSVNPNRGYQLESLIPPLVLYFLFLLPGNPSRPPLLTSALSQGSSSNGSPSLFFLPEFFEIFLAFLSIACATCSEVLQE